MTKAPATTLLQAQNIVAGYSDADMILKGCSAELRDGEIVAIIGPNGAGKSTLLKAIAGVVRVRTGTVSLSGEAITNLAPRHITGKGVAFVPQEANVFPTMTVRENLEMGGYLEPRAAGRRIDEVFARFQILADKRAKQARTLSGGQRQILAMAMALMVAPRVLMLDEPSAGLSPVAAETLFETIAAIRRDGVSVLIVEQNALDALALADRAYVLVDGQAAREGVADDLARDPDVRRLFLGAETATAA
jgi:branched-chain amino acid transport system ATP-binding protein